MIQPVKSGDSIKNPTRINQLIERSNGIEQALGARFPGVAQSGLPLFILNQTGRDLSPGDCFPYMAPDANPYTTNPERQFSGTVVIAGFSDPAPDSHEWGVAANMIPDGMSGVGYESGVMIARVRADSSTDVKLKFDPDATDWNHAILDPDGPAVVLWIDSVVHTAGSMDYGDWRWALIRLIGATGGGAGGTFSVVQATANGSGGTVACKVIQLLPDVSASPNFKQIGDSLTLNYFKA